MAPTARHAGRKTSAMTTSERQAKFMAKVLESPGKHAKYLAKERERWQKRKAAKAEKVETKRDVKHRRKGWRLAKQEYRKKQMMIANLDSPPATPEHQPAVPAASTSKVARGRRLVKKNRSVAYRTIANLKVKLSMVERNYERIRKQTQRKRTPVPTSDTPRRTTKKMLRGSGHVT